MPKSKFAAVVLPVAACACVAPPEPPARLEVGGDVGARVAIGSEPAQAPPRGVDVAAESVLPLAIEFEGRTLRGALGVAYQPRADLAMTLDAALLGAAAREDLILLGWAIDFSGATDLVYLAAADVETDALLAREVAERYTGPVSGEDLRTLFLVGLLTVGQGAGSPGSTIETRHAEGATWIEEGGRLRGLPENSACLFVRPKGGRDWLGPLLARGADARPEAPRIDADIAAALPRGSEPASCAVGDGVHGQIAAKLTADETDPRLRRLRVDLRGAEQLDAVLVVAAESAAAVQTSHADARVVEAGQGRRVVVWSIPIVELSRGPVELHCERPSLPGQAPP